MLTRASSKATAGVEIFKCSLAALARNKHWLDVLVCTRIFRKLLPIFHVACMFDLRLLCFLILRVISVCYTNFVLVFVFVYSLVLVYKLYFFSVFKNHVNLKLTNELGHPQSVTK